MSKTKIDLVTALAETFGRSLSMPAAKLYVAALGAISDDDAKRAVTIAIQKCKFFPAASELLEYAKTGGVGYEAQAILAYEELDRALGANKPSLMSPLTAAIANQLGGWEVLYAMPMDQFATWKRKDFIAAYVSLVKENPERLAAIAGPKSDIVEAMIEKMRLPSEPKAAIEDRNRKMLEDLTQPAPADYARYR